MVEVRTQGGVGDVPRAEEKEPEWLREAEVRLARSGSSADSLVEVVEGGAEAARTSATPAAATALATVASTAP